MPGDRRPGTLQWTKANCSRSSRWANKRTRGGCKEPEEARKWRLLGRRRRPEFSPGPIRAERQRPSLPGGGAAESEGANGSDGDRAKRAETPATNWPNAGGRRQRRRRRPESVGTRAIGHQRHCRPLPPFQLPTLNIGHHQKLKLLPLLPLPISTCNYSHRPISARRFHSVGRPQQQRFRRAVVVAAGVRRVCSGLSRTQSEKKKWRRRWEMSDSNNASDDRPFLRLMSRLPKRIQLVPPPLRK